MIISWMRDGLGAQMFRYACGRRLALKRNTQFKMCLAWFDKYPNPDPYRLGAFNIEENFATLEELEELKKLRQSESLGQEPTDRSFVPETLDYPDNVVLFGTRICEKYFIDIEDTIRKEFTLKSMSDFSKTRQEKIMEDNSVTVSVHLRRNFISMYDGRHSTSASDDRIAFQGLCSLNYYYSCLEHLKKFYDTLSLYIFSDDIRWVKNNFKTKFTTHYVTQSEDPQLKVMNSPAEEIFLMSLCDHHIIANSGFSWWGAWLDPNPGKKVFAPKEWSAQTGWYKDAIPEKWIKIDNMI